MTGTSLDATEHCCFQFGEHILAHKNKTNNSIEEQAVNATCPRPSSNMQGRFIGIRVVFGDADRNTTMLNLDTDINKDDNDASD